MKVYIEKDIEGNVDITNYISNATLSGEYRSSCRSLNLGIVLTGEPLEWIKNMVLGAKILLYEEEKLLFYGVAWQMSKSTQNKILNVHCKDYGIYLLKNQYSYNFKGISPDNIARKVCRDFNIEVGHLEPNPKLIHKKYFNKNLYAIIMESYSKDIDNEYFCRFVGKQLNIYKKGALVSPPIEVNNNLLSANTSQSLEAMEKINVTNLGDSRYMTGNSVSIFEPYTELEGLFFIDGDQHSWNNGIYTNQLTLNYKKSVSQRKSDRKGRVIKSE